MRVRVPVALLITLPFCVLWALRLSDKAQKEDVWPAMGKVRG